MNLITSKAINRIINNINKHPIETKFLDKYIGLNEVQLLKDRGYFCGMDYASRSYYLFLFYLSTLDHSITTAINTYNYTMDKAAAIAGLLHDCPSPCFRHVIDFMNKDYQNQETTEEKTVDFITGNKQLRSFLKQDHIDVDDVLNNLHDSVVDCKRPGLCADRIDSIILTSLCWTEEINIKEAISLYKNTHLIINEQGKPELGFKDIDTASRMIELNQIIDDATHSFEDTFYMVLLASLVKRLIKAGYIEYDELYQLTEKKLLKMMHYYSETNEEFKRDYLQFRYGSKIDENIYGPLIEEVKKINLQVKKREINPLLQLDHKTKMRYNELGD